MSMEHGFNYEVNRKGLQGGNIEIRFYMNDSWTNQQSIHMNRLFKIWIELSFYGTLNQKSDILHFASKENSLKKTISYFTYLSEENLPVLDNLFIFFERAIQNSSYEPKITNVKVKSLERNFYYYVVK